MKHPIRLTLNGDGKLVHLHGRNVRPAYFKFHEANELCARERRYFDHDAYYGETLYRLHRISCWSALADDEIRNVERQINRLVINYDFKLVYGENVIRTGYVPGRKKSTERKIKYIIKHGVIFAIKRLPRDHLLQGDQRDVLIQTRNYDFRLVRYHGITTSKRHVGMNLEFANLLDLSQTWEITLNDFIKREYILNLFDIVHFQAYPDFYIGLP